MIELRLNTANRRSSYRNRSVHVCRLQQGAGFAARVVSLCILGIAIFSCLAFGSVSRLTLRSSEAEYCIDANNGRILRILNHRTKEVYDVSNDDCRLQLDTGDVSLSGVHFTLTSKSSDSCRFAGRSGDIEIIRTYVLRPSGSYLDRGLSIRNAGKQALLLKGVTDCSLGFAKPFSSYLFHQDVLDHCDPGTEGYSETEKPIVYRTAINVFMRNSSGGLYVGLKYPYFKPKVSNGSVDLSYETNFRILPGQTLELPTMFCGVYRNTGYKCRKDMDWTPRILSAEQEEMDLGEVRAMQAVMRDHLPEYPTGFKGYFTWLNSWWANQSLQGRMGAAELEGFKKLMGNLKQSKCLDLIGIAPVWCGWAGYATDCPEIDAVGPDAKFPTNQYIDQLMAASKSTGVPISGFCEAYAPPRHYRKDHPDWVVQPTPDKSKLLNMKCQANDEYSDWFYRMICSTIDTVGVKSWSWDFGWVRRPMVCYSTAHGHEPGNCEFEQYRNVTGVIQRLRHRYPTLFFEIYWGLKEAGPWSLRGLNSLENAYENNSPAPPGMSAADDLRFQHWYNHNYRFIPTYMDLAQMNFKKEANGHVYSLLSCLSASTHASLADWIPFDTDAQADEIFGPMRKWKAWGTQHMAYLKDRVDLFGQPCRKNGIDGTAHVVGDRGYIFVFNPSSEMHWGSIPLNEMIGLHKAGRYSFDEISGDQARRLGVYAKGDDFAFSIPAKSAMLIEMLPSKDGLSRAQIPAGTVVQPAFSK